MRVRQAPVARPLEEGAEPGRIDEHPRSEARPAARGRRPALAADAAHSDTSTIPKRYSSTQAYRPLRRPTDGRGPGRLRALRRRSQGRQAEPRDDRGRLRRAPEDAAPRRQRRRRGRRLRRDDRHPAHDLGRGGPPGRPRSEPRRSTPTFAVAHVFVSRKAELRARSSTRAHQILNRGGFRVLAEREDEVDSSALGPDRARGGAALLADRGPGPGRRRRATARCSTSRSSSSRSSTLQVASFSAESCVYKVMGAPKVLQLYFNDLRDPRAETRRRCSATTATRRTPGRRSCACSRSRCSATTARSTRSRACARSRACSACRSATTPRTRRTSTA